MIQSVSTAKLVAALSMALAPVPAKSLGYQDLPVGIYDTSPSTTLQELPDNAVAFLPVTDATRHIASLTERMRSHLRNVRTTWEETNQPFYLENQSRFFRDNFHHMKDRVQESEILIKAARTALSEIPVSDPETRRQVLEFGRTVASYRYAVEAILNFLSSTHPPENLSSAGDEMSAEEVRAMIAAEHKALGLEPPVFN